MELRNPPQIDNLNIDIDQFPNEVVDHPVRTDKIDVSPVVGFVIPPITTPIWITFFIGIPLVLISKIDDCVTDKSVTGVHKKVIHLV